MFLSFYGKGYGRNTKGLSHPRIASVHVFVVLSLLEDGLQLGFKFGL